MHRFSSSWRAIYYELRAVTVCIVAALWLEMGKISDETSTNNSVNISMKISVKLSRLLVRLETFQ